MKKSNLLTMLKHIHSETVAG